MSRVTMGTLSRRLLPLQGATFASGFLFWLATEKLFMIEIGFSPATIGVMAAAYAALTPLLEVPTGVLADRWSRKGMLVIAYASVVAATVLGGLSTGVISYVLAMLMFSVYFAMGSGTADAIVYDTVLEETGDAAAYERQAGLLRALGSGSMLASALVGGWLASIAGARVTFFASVPVLLVGLVLLLAFREPTLHHGHAHPSLRAQLVTTYRTMLRTDRLPAMIGYLVLGGAATVIIMEFGQLWLIAQTTPLGWYGPFMAALFVADAAGGLLAGRLPLDRPAGCVATLVALLVAGSALVLPVPIVVVALAMMVIMTLLSVVGIYVTRRMHDNVASTVRAGVGSGVSALTWGAFVPLGLTFGGLTQAHSVQTAGWVLLLVLVAVSVLLVKIIVGRAPAPVALDAELVGAG